MQAWRWIDTVFKNITQKRSLHLDLLTAAYMADSRARRFAADVIEAIPISLPKPEVAEFESCVLLTWKVDTKNVVTILVNPNGLLSYAALITSPQKKASPLDLPSSSHNQIEFNGKFPAVVSALVRQIYA